MPFGPPADITGSDRVDELLLSAVQLLASDRRSFRILIRKRCHLGKRVRAAQGKQKRIEMPSEQAIVFGTLKDRGICRQLL